MSWMAVKVRNDLMRILLVEDNSTTQEALNSILSQPQYGHEVIYAGNGLGAITQLGISKVDILITDYLMPGMDGLELIKCLRDSKEWCSLPIVITTAMGDTSFLAESTKELQPVMVLQKPFNIDQLLVILDEVSRSDSTRVPLPDKDMEDRGFYAPLGSVP